jgi:hypothetical protein
VFPLVFTPDLSDFGFISVRFGLLRQVDLVVGLMLLLSGFCHH